MTATRIIRSIGIAGLIGWFGMVGWVARTTLAQNGGTLPVPVAPARIHRDVPPAMERAPTPLAQPALKPSELGPAPGPVKPRESAPPPIGHGEPPVPVVPA